jgi:hypothetical protein
MEAEKNKEEVSENAKIPKEELRLMYTELLEGVTPVSIEKKSAFLKHNGAYDANKVDVVKYESFKKAKEEGLPTREEQTKYLIKEGLWTKEQDDSIVSLVSYSKNLNTTLKKMYLKAQQEGLKQKIKETDKEIEKLEQEKKELTGYTAEGYSEKKANEYHLSKGLFKDYKCEELYFSEEEFEHLDERILTELIGIYSEGYNKYSQDNIKRIALMPYFLNSFYLCNDNPFTFFGKAIVNLTFNQISLFGQGKYFKHVFSTSKNPPPDEIMEDPDELINWFEQSKEAEGAMAKIEAKAGKSADSAKENTGKGGTSLVGATKEDLKRLGIGQSEHESISLDSAAKKKGGKLNMQDLIKLHGVGKN